MRAYGELHLQLELSRRAAGKQAPEPSSGARACRRFATADFGRLIRWLHQIRRLLPGPLSLHSNIMRRGIFPTSVCGAREGVTKQTLRCAGMHVAPSSAPSVRNRNEAGSPAPHAVHHKGKPIERWGRKTSGLTALKPMTAELPEIHPR